MVIDIRSYRFWSLFLYLLLLSVITHVLHAGIVAFALLPFSLFFYEISSYRFFIIYIAGYTLFFEPSTAASNVRFLIIPDVCLISFLVLYLFFKRDYTVSVLLHRCLIPLYIFIAYVFIMALPVISQLGLDGSLLYDIKKFLVLLTVVFFIQQPIFNPTKIFSLLFIVVACSSLSGFIHIINFALTHSRVISWTEIYFGNSLIIAVVMLTTIKNAVQKKILGVLSIVLFISLLVTQTRSIWVSTCLSLVLYMLFYLRGRIRRIKFASVIKVVLGLCVLLVVLQIIAQVALHTNIQSFFLKRMTQGGSDELTSPFASLGYRLYESAVVWLHRSFWGHGTGAYLYLFQTQMHSDKFMYWWSIHCEYMEILHKWGFFGLCIYLWFLAVYFVTAFKLMLSKKRIVSSLGSIAFLIFFNTAITSLTSGYMFRVNMIILDILLVGIVVNYSNRINHIKKNYGAAESDNLPVFSSSTTDES